MRVRWWLRTGPSRSVLRHDEAHLWVALYPLTVGGRDRPVLCFRAAGDDVPAAWMQGMEVDVVGEARPGGAFYLRQGGDEVWPASVPRVRVVGAPRWDEKIVGRRDVDRSVGVTVRPWTEDSRPWIHVALWITAGALLIVRIAGGLAGGPWLWLMLGAVLIAEVVLWSNSARHRKAQRRP